MAEYFKIVSSDLIPENDPRIRTFYHYLATGTRRGNSWYRQLNQVEIIDDCSSNTTDIFGFMRVQSSGNQFSSNNEVNCSGEDVDGDILEESTDMDIGILNDTETIKKGFMTAMVNFKDVVLKRLDEDPLNYAKCVKSFTNQLKTVSTSNHSLFQKTVSTPNHSLFQKTVSTSNHSLFQKAVFSFIDDKTMPAKKGRKRKISIHRRGSRGGIWGFIPPQFFGSENYFK